MVRMHWLSLIEAQGCMPESSCLSTQALLCFRKLLCCVAIQAFIVESSLLQVADYGMVGDLFEVLPELESRLRDIV